MAAYLILGVRVADVVTSEMVAGSVTKYNEDTGAPYQKEVTKRAWRFCGREVAGPEGYDPDADDDDGLGLPAEWLERMLGIPDVCEANVPGDIAVKGTGDADGGENDVFGLVLMAMSSEFTGAAECPLPTQYDVDKIGRKLAEMGYAGAPPALHMVLGDE